MNKWRDVLAVALIAAGFGAAWLLLPLAHDFAILDDWAYAPAVEKLAAGAGLHPIEAAQATFVTQAYWGLLFRALLGPGFTALTAATMALSLVAALAFYVLLRRLGFAAGLAGLGVAVLTLNPYYVNLSYSFMTEIPFLACLLLSCLLYLEGLVRIQGSCWANESDPGRAARAINRASTPRRSLEAALGGRGAGWLWAASVCAALAYLIRQFGLALPLAAAVWLLLARRLRPRTLAAVALLPALAAAGYALWSSGFGTTFSGSVGREEVLALFRGPGPWVQRAAHFVYLAAFLPGLTIPLFSPARRPWLTAGLSGAAALAVFGLWQVKTGLVAAGQSTLDDLSYSWLQPVFPDPTLVYCLGAALTVWLLAGLVARAGGGFLARLRARAAAPADFLALVALILFGGVYLVSAGFLDRYWLPLLPFLIAAALVPFRDAGRLRLAGALLALAVLAVYGALLHLDQYDAAAADWAAGRALVARGVHYTQIANDPAWEGYFLYAAALASLPSHDVAVLGRVYPPRLILDPIYVVAADPPPGYHVVARYPYLARLSGWQSRAALVWQRDGAGR